MAETDSIAGSAEPRTIGKAPVQSPSAASGPAGPLDDKLDLDPPLEIPEPLEVEPPTAEAPAPAPQAPVPPPAGGTAGGGPAKAESSFARRGQSQRIVHFDTQESRASCRDILESDLYDWPVGIKPPTLLWDVGAYVGAASLAFARQFPAAAIHAFEPCAAARGLLQENLGGLPKATVHETAVWYQDGKRTLYAGKGDPLTASLVRSPLTETQGEEVSARHADALLDALGLSRVDGLKIATGGCEVAILEALIRHLEAIPVVFIDYRSETDRRRIDLILCATHMLLKGRIYGPQHGHLCYGLRRVLSKEGSGEDMAVRLHRRPDN